MHKKLVRTELNLYHWVYLRGVGGHAARIPPLIRQNLLTVAQHIDPALMNHDDIYQSHIHFCYGRTPTSLILLLLSLNFTCTFPLFYAIHR